MTKHKLSGDVDMLHVWLHEKRQKLGIKAIKNRKRQEKSDLHYRNNEKNWLREFNKEGDRLAREGKIPMLKDADRPTKRQKLSDQIQHGFDIATKWKRKQRTNEEIFLEEVVTK